MTRTDLGYRELWNKHDFRMNVLRYMRFADGGIASGERHYSALCMVATDLDMSVEDVREIDRPESAAYPTDLLIDAMNMKLMERYRAEAAHDPR